VLVVVVVVHQVDAEEDEVDADAEEDAVSSYVVVAA